MTTRKPYRPDYALIDGNALAFRSLFSHESLSVKIKGETIYTGMVFGFLRMMLVIKREFRPRHLAVVWDGGSRRKKEVYPQYKEGRKIQQKDMSFEDIITSLNMCRKLIKYIGVQQYRVFGEEGDDLISSFIAQHEGKVLIISNDHDMFQLLEDTNVRLLRFKQSDATLWTRSSFMRAYPFSPKYYPHYLSIVGDKTDNIPGIRGIGEVKALDIFSKISSPTLEALYDEIHGIDVTPKIKEAIVQGQEDAFMFFSIIALSEDITINPIDFPVPRIKSLIDLMTKLKFKSILQNEDDMETLCKMHR